MSIAAFIIGLLVWLSMPAFLQGRVAAERLPLVRSVCKWLGIVILAIGVVCGL